MILRAISSHKQLQTPTNLFLASLSVADLLITLFMPIETVRLTFMQVHYDYFTKNQQNQSM